MIRIAAAAAAAVLFTAGAASAQPIPEGGLTAPEVAAWLQAQGLEVQVGTGEQPSVSTGANGVSWDVAGFDCVEGRCSSWQFSAGFLMDSLAPDAINTWNRDWRFLKAFSLPQDGGVAALAQYDVLLVPGTTYEGLTDHMVLFATVAPRFGEHIGWQPQTATAPAE